MTSWVEVRMLKAECGKQVGQVVKFSDRAADMLVNRGAAEYTKAIKGKQVSNKSLAKAG